MATTTDLKIESVENMTIVTEYSFKVFASETHLQINEITVYVDEDGGESVVWYHDSLNDYTSKEKFFNDSDEAHFYALSLAKKLKDKSI